MPEEVATLETPEEPKRKRGRPLGSRNKAPRRVMPTGSMYPRRLRYSKAERLPSPGRTRQFAFLARQAEKSIAEARRYNRTITEEDRETYYLAGMNRIAERIWLLARMKKPHVEELRQHLEMYLKHREIEIKKQKTAVMLRHLELLESKRKLLEEAAKDRGLSDAQFFGKIREVFFPASNGQNPIQGRPPKLIENGFTA